MHSHFYCSLPVLASSLSTYTNCSVLCAEGVLPSSGLVSAIQNWLELKRRRDEVQVSGKYKSHVMKSLITEKYKKISEGEIASDIFMTSKNCGERTSAF